MDNVGAIKVAGRWGIEGGKNMVGSASDRKSVGNEFQSLGAATENDLEWKAVAALGTTRKFPDDERRVLARV